MTKQQAEMNAESLSSQFATMKTASFVVNVSELTNTATVSIVYRGVEIAKYRDVINLRADRVKRVLLEARDAHRAAQA